MIKNAKVYGTVTKLIGNHMPGPGRKSDPGIPLSRVPIHVFNRKLRPFQDPSDRPALSLFLTGHSDTDGSFEFSLPPGTYTIVAEINGQMYLNSYSGDGYWSYITVRDGDQIRFDIVDTSEAVF